MEDRPPAEKGLRGPFPHRTSTFTGKVFIVMLRDPSGDACSNQVAVLRVVVMATLDTAENHLQAKGGGARGLGRGWRLGLGKMTTGGREGGRAGFLAVKRVMSAGVSPTACMPTL